MEISLKYNNYFNYKIWNIIIQNLKSFNFFFTYIYIRTYRSIFKIFTIFLTQFNWLETTELNQYRYISRNSSCLRIFRSRLRSAKLREQFYPPKEARNGSLDLSFLPYPPIFRARITSKRNRKEKSSSPRT